MTTIWGYPLKAIVDVHGVEVDITEAVVFDTWSPSGILGFNDLKVLDLISDAESAAVERARADAEPPFDWATLEEPPDVEEMGVLVKKVNAALAAENASKPLHGGLLWQCPHCHKHLSGEHAYPEDDDT